MCLAQGHKAVTLVRQQVGLKIIIISNECKSGIENSVPRITVWHHKVLAKR